MQVKGAPLEYTAAAGLLPIVLDETAGPAGSMFFVHYTLDDGGDPASRPLTFCFNGGPGSASCWLHLGGLAPKKVELLPDGGMPAPPYRLVDNDETWLPTTDLVFVDAMGTGYSRPATPDDGPKFWGAQEDQVAFTEFIRAYLIKYSRWNSPLYLAGESYGTFRSAGLATTALNTAGIAFQGILLISSVLSMNTLWEASSANHLPHLTFLPTYTATAWYHNALLAELQAKPLRSVLDEAEAWTLDVYAPALAKGEARLSDRERAAVIAGLVRYTGLSRVFIEGTNLQINDGNYRKELLRSSRRTVRAGRPSLVSLLCLRGDVAIQCARV
jgi:carboxypeptidase C (cathepsin A)